MRSKTLSGVRALLRGLLVLPLLAANLVHAAPSEAKTDQVRVRLIPSVSAAYPGEEILVGLQQKMIPKWHTYWINPGDSGTPTSIKWSLPPGASAGDIKWPIPHRFSVALVTSYGYSDEVTLLSPIKVPADLRPGATFAATAKVSWLVCEEICIPQQAELGFQLPILAAGADRPPPNAAIRKAQAQLPVASPWPIKAEAGNQEMLLRITGSELSGSSVKDVWFYPQQWGKVAHNRPQTVSQSRDGIVLTVPVGEAPLKVGERLQGVLVVTEAMGTEKIARGFNVDLPLAAAAPAAGIGRPAALAGIDAPGFPAALLFAFLGGIILNLMPCVFPVLSIKALSLIRHADADARSNRLSGLAYTGGILTSFAVLASALIALKVAGGQIGWGFQFQSPLFVLGVAWLMFAIGLNLSGVFEVGTSVTHLGSGLAEKPGYAGSFFTGVLATVVATPCTAPFMGAALGYALAQPPAVMLAVFMSLGLGLALPYLLISTWPRLQRLLPRPGAWMERFKQFLAFPMYAAAAWLVWVLAQQAGDNALAAALGGMVLIALAAWIFAETRLAQPLWRRGATLLALLIVAVAGVAARFSVDTVRPAETAKYEEKAGNWSPYSAQRLQELRAKGEPVFINLTAAWCLTCLVNERVALSQASVIDAFKQKGITYLKGDWTNQDPEITQLLAQFGRSGVPLYVLYPPGEGEPQVLPQILTPEIVLAAVEAAAPTAIASSHPK